MCEQLEARINFGFIVADPGDETPPPGPPPIWCPTPPTPQTNGNEGSPPPAASDNPVRYSDGTPVVAAVDLSSAGFGGNFGHTRTWTGLNNGSLNGNGWSIAGLPYLVVAGGRNGNNAGAYVYELPDRISIVSSGSSGYTFSINAAGDTYAPWDGSTNSLSWVTAPTPKLLKLTDSNGNVTEFYDVRRDGSGHPITGSLANDVAQLYGRFKSFTSADGATTVSAAYDVNGYLTSVTRQTGTSGPAERNVYAYATVTNDLVTAAGGTPAKLIASVELQRNDGVSPTWVPVQRADYTYYTGRVPNGSGGWMDDPDGRLGDLKLAAVSNSGSGQATAVSALTRSGSTATATATGHGLAVGDLVTLGGADQAEYGGAFVVTAATSTTFSFAVKGSPASPATGTITAYRPNDVSYYRYYKFVGESFDNYDSSKFGSRPDGASQGPTNDVATTGGPVPLDDNEFFAADLKFVNSGLKTIVTGASFARLVANYADFESVPNTDDYGAVDANGDGDATNDSILAYANNYFEYERWADHTNFGDLSTSSSSTYTYNSDFMVGYRFGSRYRVTKEIAQGAGCSTCSGGFGTSEFSYALSPHGGSDFSALEYNTWRYKTTEYLPDATLSDKTDNDRRIVYANELGQPMLDVRVDGKGTSSQSDDVAYPTYYRYDETNGRLLLTAHPSAVVAYDPASPSTFEGYADLVQFSSSTATNLNNTTGLIETVAYGTATTATSGTAGDVVGYVKSRSVQQGDTGTPVLQHAQNYRSRTDSATGATIYVVDGETRYRNTDGTGGQTTTYAYTWLGSTTQVASTTTTNPTVTTAQNGSNAATSSTDVYDQYGRVVWSKDADGFITYTAYDPSTGAVTERIVDVNTASVANEPSGWTTPAGGGKHLTTTTLVDSLGRTTKVTDPNGNVTHTVYNDAKHETRVYRGWTGSGSTGSTTGPIEVIREYRPAANAPAGERTVYFETILSSATPATASGVPTGTETIDSGNIQSMSRRLTNDADQVTRTDAYVTLASVTYSAAEETLGTAGTNYLRTETDYDGRGRLKRIEEPNGTIRWTVYDGLDRVISTWVGTNDTGAVNGDPDGTGSPNNMVKVTENEYDDPTDTLTGGGVGDGNLTKSLEWFGTGGTDFYATRYQYDFRDRLTNTRGPDGVATAYTYDNLGQVTKVETFADADSDFVIDSTELRGKSESEFDERGQLYRSRVYEVDPSTGVTAERLTTNMWYDARGNVIKTAYGSGQFAFRKAVYDGAGRQIATYLSSQHTETAYADADDVVGDEVIEQTKTIYDAGGRPVVNTSYAKMNSSPSTGELGASNSYIQTAVTWYDNANRPIATANYGRDNGRTNGVSGGTRYVFNSSGVLIDSDSDGLPDEAENAARTPNTSDDYIVTKVEYDAAGRTFRTTDNGGRATETMYDMLGRQAKLVENYIDGTLTEGETDTDRTTTWTYDSAGRLWKMTARNPKGSNGGSTTDNVEDQVTTYLYESPINTGWVTNTIYPDSSDTTSAGTDQVKATYDRLGRQLTSTDQRGVVHTYAYDAAGRLLSDAITTLPSGVDGAVRRIQRTYDDLSRVQAVTSYDAVSGGNIVNEVRTTYDGWGNVIESEQAHAGGVTTGTPSVQYNYIDGPVSGESMFVTLSSISYPDGRTITYNYDTRHGYALGQAYSMGDGDEVHAGFDWVGTNRISRVTTSSYGSYNEMIELDYGLHFDLGGYDRFGRIIMQQYHVTGTGMIPDSVYYTYDRNSNRLTADREVDSGYGSFNGHDSTYTYDGLNRLTGWDRGTFSSGTLTNAVYTQDWDTLDALGNWQTFTDDTNGAASGGATTQNRTHNAANEMTADGGSWVDPVYDAAGNMTTMPVAGDETTARYLIYDGWNRLVGASQNDDGDATDAQDYRYSYDGLGRRIRSSDGTGTTYTDFYLSEQNQILETRVNGETEADEQFVWGPTYVDALLARIRSDGSGAPVADLAMVDANYNVISLFTNDGVAQRYEYTPYGLRTEVNAALDTTLSKPLSIGHQGLWHDVETGLVYNRARMLHVTLGRFVQRDPIGFAGGPNLSLYQGDNPLTRVDPLGTDWYTVSEKQVITSTFTESIWSEQVYYEYRTAYDSNGCPKCYNVGYQKQIQRSGNFSDTYAAQLDAISLHGTFWFVGWVANGAAIAALFATGVGTPLAAAITVVGVGSAIITENTTPASGAARVVVTEYQKKTFTNVIVTGNKRLVSMNETARLNCALFGTPNPPQPIQVPPLPFNPGNL